MASFSCAADMKQLDLMNLEQSIRNLEAQGIDELHFDVADGRFVPQFGFSDSFLTATKSLTKLPCHAHLLVEQPDRMLPALLETNVDVITLHVETCIHIHRALSLIRDSGKKAGLALSPATPLTKLNYCLPKIDRLVLLGTDPVSPAVGMPRALFERVRIANENIRYHEYAIEIDVEGPLQVEDAARCLRFGAKRLILDPADVSGLGDISGEVLQHYRQEVECTSHTV